MHELHNHGLSIRFVLTRCLNIEQGFLDVDPGRNINVLDKLILP